MTKFLKKSFKHQFSSWTKDISENAEVNWTEQLSILNKIADLITPRLSLEEIIEVIYENVNQLTDAYQFCVVIYDEKEGLLHYKGLIENGKRFPDFSIDALDDSRLGSWCIRNEQDIFMNDVDKEYSKYVAVNPKPLTGIQPKAALYTPLRLNNADEIARMLQVKWQLGLNGSVLIANPVPAEREINAAEMETYILTALKAAAENKITG